MKTLKNKIIDRHMSMLFQRLAERPLKHEKEQEVFTFLNQYANGILIKKKLDEGLSLLIWDGKLKRRLELSKKASPSSSEKDLSIVFVLTPELLTIKKSTDREYTRMSQISNTVFFCDRIDFDFSISSYAPFHLIQVDVSADWLSEQLGYPDFKKNLENIFVKANGSYVLSYSSYSEHRLLHHIDTTMYTEERNNPALVATVLQLLSELISRLMQDEPASKSMLHTVNYDKVAQVEDIISKNLAGTLPSLEWIARHSTQSVSSLMRHFKYVHGKTIYEYYLEKKMELAMKILSENAISVNEVADKLGYEKASSFITIFKKYYGHCPGAIKQRPVLN